MLIGVRPTAIGRLAGQASHVTQRSTFVVDSLGLIGDTRHSQYLRKLGDACNDQLFSYTRDPRVE